MLGYLRCKQNVINLGEARVPEERDSKSYQDYHLLCCASALLAMAG